MTPQPITLEETIFAMECIRERLGDSSYETDLSKLLESALHHLEAGKRAEAQLEWLLNALNTKTPQQLQAMSVSAFWRGGVKLDRGDIWSEMQREADMATTTPTEEPQG